jgi:Protein of unknown function (DUF2971)
MSPKFLERPASLFKFRAFSTATDQDRVRDILFNGELWMSSRLAFNDPFDCELQLDFEASEEQVVAWLAERIREKEPELSLRERFEKAVARAEERWPLTKEKEEATALQVQNEVNQMGIVSFTATRDPILLWSHYAGGHSGLCLEFSETTEGDFLKFAKRVVYSDQYPTIRIYGDRDPERSHRLVLTKSDIWSYEQEWRAVSPTQCNCPAPFHPENLVGITVGSRMTEENIELVKQWVEELGGHMKLQRALQQTGRYLIAFEDL